MSRNEARTYRHIEVQPVGGSLGAEIRGVNVAAALDDAVIAEIRQAFLDHLVVFFRDQKLTPPEQLAFARRFGEPMEYPQLKGLPECPLITPVLKLAHETINFGGVWHSDTTYLTQPPMASMLYAATPSSPTSTPRTRRSPTGCAGHSTR
jgi:taurine dioxygenase